MSYQSHILYLAVHTTASVVVARMTYEYNYFYAIIVEVQTKIFAATIYNCADECLYGISGGGCSAHELALA